MDTAEFEDFLERHGEDISRWPTDQSPAAIALLANSGDAQALYNEAVAMRALFAGQNVSASPKLKNQIMDEASRITVVRRLPEHVPLLERLENWLGLSSRGVRVGLLTVCFAACLIVTVLFGAAHLNLGENNFPDYFLSESMYHLLKSN